MRAISLSNSGRIQQHTAWVVLLTDLSSRIPGVHPDEGK